MKIISSYKYKDLDDGICCVYLLSNGSLKYIGSTKDLKKRIGEHINKCYNSNIPKYNLKVYQQIRSNGGWNDFNFTIVEHIDNPETLIEREQYYYDVLRPELNSQRPVGLTITEYYQINKDKIAERNADYYQINKEKIAEYRQNNKEKIAERNAEYYQSNKNKIIERQVEYKRQIVECKVCNKTFRRDNLSKHNKSKQHQQKTASVMEQT